MSLQTTERKKNIVELIYERFTIENEIIDRNKQLARTREVLASRASLRSNSGRAGRAFGQSVQAVEVQEEKLKELREKLDSLNSELGTSTTTKNPFIQELLNNIQNLRNNPQIRGRKAADVRARKRIQIKKDIEKSKQRALDFEKKIALQNISEKASIEETAEIPNQKKQTGINPLILIGGALLFLV